MTTERLTREQVLADWHAANRGGVSGAHVEGFEYGWEQAIYHSPLPQIVEALEWARPRLAIAGVFPSELVRVDAALKAAKEAMG